VSFLVPFQIVPLTLSPEPTSFAIYGRTYAHTKTAVFLTNNTIVLPIGLHMRHHPTYPVPKLGKFRPGGAPSARLRPYPPPTLLATFNELRALRCQDLSSTAMAPSRVIRMVQIKSMPRIAAALSLQAVASRSSAIRWSHWNRKRTIYLS
jgi:hypothetical protein